MNDPDEALARLKTLITSRTAKVWLEGARVARGPDGGAFLHVSGPFQKRRLEEQHGDALAACGLRVVAPVEEPAPLRTAGGMAVPAGPGGELAVRLVNAFAENRLRARLLVVHGPPRSGKALLAALAARRGGDSAFRLELDRLRAGGSRNFVPRKPLVIAEGVETIAARAGAQKTLSLLLDAVWDRGGRVLATLLGHPGRTEGLIPGLRSRLLGGVLVPLTPSPSAAQNAGTEIDRYMDAAARAFGIERSLLLAGTKRRSVVEARRGAMAVAARKGHAEAAIAAAFRLRSTRTVREACRWAEARAARDAGFAVLLREVAGVVPPQ